MPSQKKSLILNEAGFTLLEIIAVMVIMSILAVVAIPKYFDLQAQARQKAMETAMAEAIGRVNSYFAQQVLSGQVPDDIDYATDTPLGTDLGDFILQVEDAGPITDGSTLNCSTYQAGCIRLTITANSPALSDATLDPRIIPRPGSV